MKGTRRNNKFKFENFLYNYKECNNFNIANYNFQTFYVGLIRL